MKFSATALITTEIFKIIFQSALCKIPYHVEYFIRKPHVSQPSPFFLIAFNFRIWLLKHSVYIYIHSFSRAFKIYSIYIKIYLVINKFYTIHFYIRATIFFFLAHKIRVRCKRVWLYWEQFMVNCNLINNFVLNCHLYLFSIFFFPSTKRLPTGYCFTYQLWISWRRGRTCVCQRTNGTSISWCSWSILHSLRYGLRVMYWTKPAALQRCRISSDNKPLDAIP